MSLESKVNDHESGGFMKKALRMGFNLMAAGAATALSLATVGTLGIAVGASFAAGGAIANYYKGKSLFDIAHNVLKTYTAVNTVIYPIVGLGNISYPLISSISGIDLTGKIMRGLYSVTLYNAAFLGSFKAADHLVENYLNPVGMWNTVKKDFLKEWAAISLLFSPFYVADALNVTNLGIMNSYAPVFAVGALPVGWAYNRYFGPEAKNRGWTLSPVTGSH